MLELSPKPPVGAEPLRIDHARITLAERAGPMLSLRLTTGQNLSDDKYLGWHESLAAGTEVDLALDGAPILSAFLLGFEPERVAEGVAPAVRAVALVLPEASRLWFDLPIPGADGLLWVVAQRERGEHPWDFLAGTLNGKLSPVPANPDWEKLFGPEACVLRVGAWTNRCFLEHLVTLLAERTSAIWGWCATADEAQPLRLITDLAPVDLDNAWRVSPPPFRPSTLAGADWARRPLRVTSRFRCLDGPQLFRLLATEGKQAQTDQFAPAVPDRTGQLVVLPGAVNLAGQMYQAPRIHYDWGLGGTVEAHLELRLPMKPPARGGNPRQVFEASIRGWQSKTGGETSLGVVPASSQLGPGNAPTWGVLAAGAIDANRPLYGGVLTPFAGRPAEPSAGIYTAWKGNEPVLVLVASGQAPVILGQVQRFTPGLENVGLSVSAASLLFTASPPAAAEPDDAIRLSPGIMTARAGKFVEVMGNLTVEADRTKVAGAAEFGQGMKVVGNVELQAGATVAKNLTVGGEFEAGS